MLLNVQSEFLFYKPSPSYEGFAALFKHKAPTLDTRLTQCIVREAICWVRKSKLTFMVFVYICFSDLFRRVLHSFPLDGA